MNQLNSIVLILKGRGPDQVKRKPRSDKGVSRGGKFSGGFFQDLIGQHRDAMGKPTGPTTLIGVAHSYREIRPGFQGQRKGDLISHTFRQGQGHMIKDYAAGTNKWFANQAQAHAHLNELGIGNPVDVERLFLHRRNIFNSGTEHSAHLTDLNKFRE